MQKTEHKSPLLLLCLASFLLGLPACTSDKQGPGSIVDRLEDAERFSSSQPPASGTANAQTSEVPTAGTFKVKFETTAGDFVVLVHRDWAPLGAARFHELVKSGFYDECRFFRVVPGFMVQFGMNGDPARQRLWEKNIRDDEPMQTNKKGIMTFATSGRNSRTTQVFINYGDNSFLDTQGFAPFGEVIDGMQNVEAIYSGYKERPEQGQIKARGNDYLNASFPELDSVRKATIFDEVTE